VFHLDIGKRPALCADCVIVPPGYAVEPARTVPETDFGDVPGFLQKPQAVIYRGKADARQQSPRAHKDLVRGQVPVILTYHLQNNRTLSRQTRIICG
jgi:hypothetical protein